METDNTARSFHDKWHENPALGFDEILNEDSDTFAWILERNGFGNPLELREFLRGKKGILDAGCGNGRATALLRRYSAPDTGIAAIDLVSADVARKNLESLNVSVSQADLLGDLAALGTFDFIYCQEVLHHTGNPAAAFANLCSLLDHGGEIAIYVYKRKAPAREFVDDFIRDKIKDMPYDEAMQVCEQITQLGKVLSELDLKVQLPAVDVLEIPEGEYDIQRFIYHFFMKCYWNDGYSMHDNVVINYDWYHPQLCSRHTIEEVRHWFVENGLRIVHEHVDFYGLTMRGMKA